MIIENSFEQGSDLWKEKRLKSIGGTGISKIITSKGERSKSRDDYLIDKASQILTGKKKQIFQTYEMAWGHEYEPEARGLFEFIHGIELSQCAMIFKDDSKRWHISPDGFNEELETGFEVKCPQLKEFKKTVDGNKLPTSHILQVQTSLALTGYKTWHFQSYFPGLKPFHVEVKRDESLIKIIRAEVNIFLKDLELLIEELKQ